jgi:hypothetical protein
VLVEHVARIERRDRAVPEGGGDDPRVDLNAGSVRLGDDRVEMFAAFAASTSFVTCASLKIPSPNASTQNARNSPVDARAAPGATPIVRTIATTTASENARRITTSSAGMRRW